ncbi:fasciclin [Mycobacterium gordonae]|uniref:Fasciclin n=1 Tax=Mycobacterium gordonae TaxID=1778 RepID=A0A1A6B9C3_MYCGO|nr:fasciclin domain-containing protein [Mycobacterium gordonae]MCQ4360259.1 fasciclin domain-containing protein [Mycobacterium gordonae]OBR98922.1 fasciclin [Mycobacterium gordonae]
MMNTQAKSVAAAALAAIAIAGVAGCSNSKPASQGTSSATSASVSATSSVTPPSAPSSADPAADLIGPGCSEYAAQNPTGPGSVAGMAQDPVATAASNNPMLSSLTSALSGKLNPQVNLVDTLNSGQYTVFAPTNAAFDKLPAATIDQLKTDAKLLNNILTYHVVNGQASPAKVAGTHKTLQGADVTVTGAGNDLKVNTSGLLCGGVHTANATVYMIDTVLMPPA